MEIVVIFRINLMGRWLREIPTYRNARGLLCPLQFRYNGVEIRRRTEGKDGCMCYMDEDGGAFLLGRKRERQRNTFYRLHRELQGHRTQVRYITPYVRSERYSPGLRAYEGRR